MDFKLVYEDELYTSNNDPLKCENNVGKGDFIKEQNDDVYINEETSGGGSILGTKRKMSPEGLSARGCGDSDDKGKLSNGTRNQASRLAKRVARRRRPSSDSNHLEKRKVVDSDDSKDLQVSESSSGLNKGKQQSFDDSVYSFNNVGKIGEQIGVVWDEIEGPMEGVIGSKDPDQGFRKRGKVGWIEDIVRDEKPCVFGFQETNYAIGRSRGLLLIWDSNVFTSSGVVSGDRFIAVKGSWKGIEGEVVLANVHGYHVTEKKVELWSRVSRLMDSVDGGCCLFGDFYDVREPGDRLNSEFNTRDVENFNEFIRRNSLVDIQLGGKLASDFSNQQIMAFFVKDFEHLEINEKLKSAPDNVNDNKVIRTGEVSHSSG
ncbi:RNA-directed DNA polymerase, eukaryota [Artemisia annua]|uniref:RNA-directed DNA polymerase, eukaryota n=1 Tax=Artemisia annua TaxID=35608 RepID=A0A2U1MQ35_ARTAN|nr:RNA-directed DNA polymerase, eukaryota [Artemisia annua]